MVARLAREILLALALLAFGLIVLPALVYIVGQLIIGAYDDGLMGLYGAIAESLTAGNAFAWLLVLAPYLCIQLIRLLVFLRPARQA